MPDYAKLRAAAEAMLVPHAGAVDDRFFELWKPGVCLEVLAAAEAVKPKLDAYTGDFEEAWDAYPPRAGANKRAAFKAWNARIRAGITPTAMLAGVIRYAAYVRSERTEERFIKQPSTFFGPDEHFALPWVASRGQAMRQDANAEAKRRLFGGDDFGVIDAQG